MNPLKTIAALLLAGTIATQAQSIVERRGALKVSGSKIVDQAGKPIQLTGMSFYWSQWATKFYTKATVDWLVSDWKCTVVRAAMAVDSSVTGYLKSPTPNLNAVNKVVEAAIANGIYVIIDWHEEMAVNHTAQSKTFFTMMAKKYGSYPNVIFEIYNEPHNADPDLNPTWATIKPYAEEVISGIRQYSTNLVIVGTANYSQDVDEAALDPIDPAVFGDVAYTLHFYAGTHGAAFRTKATTAMAAGIPIFVTEWGTTTSDGGQPKGTPAVIAPIATTATNAWFTYLNQNKISTCNWSVSDKFEGASALVGGAPISGWDPAVDLTSSGNYVRNLTISQCEKDPTVCPYLGNPPAAFSVPGSIPAASFTQAFGVLKESSTEASGGIQLTSVDSGDWASYTVNADVSDTFEVRARVSGTGAGGTITIHSAGGDIAIPVQSSGTPDTWTWAYSTNRVVIPAGQSVIETRFTGRGQNLFKLHHIEFVKNASKVLAAPGPIPANAYSLPLTLTGLVSLTDGQNPYLSKMKTTGTATYTVNIPQSGTYSFSANVASGSNGGLLTVRIVGGPAKKNTIQIPSTGGWANWQWITSAFDLTEGPNVINILATGDTSALFSLSDLRISEGVSVLPRSRAQGLGLVRSSSGLLLSLGESKGFRTADLLSSDGRILSHTDIAGLNEIRLPLQPSHLPLWIRLKGETTATLAVPPSR